MYFSDSIRPWFRLRPVVGPLYFSPFCNSAFYDGILRCSVCLHSGNRRPWLPHYGWFVRIYILASWRRCNSIDCLLHPGMAKTSACVKLPSRAVHFLVPVSFAIVFLSTLLVHEKIWSRSHMQLCLSLKSGYDISWHHDILGPSFPTSSDVFDKNVTSTASVLFSL